MSIEATYDLKLSVAETPSLSLDSGDDPTITRSTSTSGKLTGSTSTPATTNVIVAGNLSGGTATIDLTSITDGNLGAKSFTGLKIQLFKVTATSTNTAVLAIDDGAASAYNIFGAASRGVSLPAGATIYQFAPEGLADVSASAKNIDLASTDADAGYTVEIVGG